MPTSPPHYVDLVACSECLIVLLGLLLGAACRLPLHFAVELLRGSSSEMPLKQLDSYEQLQSVQMQVCAEKMQESLHDGEDTGMMLDMDEQEAKLAAGLEEELQQSVRAEVNAHMELDLQEELLRQMRNDLLASCRDEGDGI